jgi:UDP-glucose 4-epimerase
MKILFTGASSFSGMWFVKELAEAGHEVKTCFRYGLDDYQGLRRKRVDIAMAYSQPTFHCTFGSTAFLKCIDSEPRWDLFCHHAADVTDYKSPDFDVTKAVTNNTYQLKQVLHSLSERGCQHVLLTGSVFEPYEGVGSDLLRAVSPYGLSKGLTTEIFRYFTELLGLKLGKFVIPNPFGPFEEMRYTSYLIQSWAQHKIPIVQSPDYVRDNIPISLLAKSYLCFAQRLQHISRFEKFNPSGYVESQGAFTLRFAEQMRSRLSLPCLFELKEQTDFSEPTVRINTDRLNTHQLNWKESQAWDDLAKFYRDTYFH